MSQRAGAKRRPMTGSATCGVILCLETQTRISLRSSGLRLLDSRWRGNERMRCSNATETRPGSLRLDARELDHLGPLLRVVGNELSEIGRRARDNLAAQVDEPGLDPRIGQARVDLVVEPVDDLGRRIARRADAVPGARLVARD